MLAIGLLKPASERITTIAFTSLQQKSGTTTLITGVADALVRNSNRRVLLVDMTNSCRQFSQLLKMSLTPVDFEQNFSQAEINAKMLGIHTHSKGFDVACLAWKQKKQARQEFEQWWQALIPQYDVILLDTGSLETDIPYHFSSYIENYVLVLDANQVTREMLEYFRRDGRLNALPFKGFLINNKRFYVPDFIYRLLT